MLRACWLKWTERWLNQETYFCIFVSEYFYLRNSDFDKGSYTTTLEYCRSLPIILNQWLNWHNNNIFSELVHLTLIQSKNSKEIIIIFKTHPCALPVHVLYRNTEKKIDIRIIPPLYTKVVFNSLYIVTIIQSKRIILWIDIQNLGYSLKVKPKSSCIVLNGRKRWGVHNVLLFISIVKLSNYLPVEHLFRKYCQQKVWVPKAAFMMTFISCFNIGKTNEGSIFSLPQSIPYIPIATTLV